MCKHPCHCACNSEIGTCIINDAGRQATHTKKQRKYTFYAHDLKVNINFKRQNQLSKKFTQLDDIIPFKY